MMDYIEYLQLNSAKAQLVRIEVDGVDH